MDKKLPGVEHLPPMRVPLFWQGEVRMVGHVAVRRSLRLARNSSKSAFSTSAIRGLHSLVGLGPGH